MYDNKVASNIRSKDKQSVTSTKKSVFEDFTVDLITSSYASF